MKRLLLVPVLAVAFDGCGGGDAAPAPPPSGALPAWVNALAIGQWYQIPNTAMSSADLPNIPIGAWNKVNAWTSFVADPRTSKVYSVANGGHNDYDGNEVDVLDLEREQPLWSEILPSTPGSQRTNCSYYFADGRPTSRHSYYGVTFNEFDDRFMLFGGAWACSSGGFFSGTSSYNIGANSYNGTGTHPDVPFLGSTALDPFTGDVYIAASGGLTRWNRSSNTFTSPNPTGTGPAGGGGAAFDTSRNRILFLGGQSSDRHIYTLSGNAWSTVTLSGANASDVASAEQGAMFYVAAIDSYLVRLDNAGGTAYRVNASTFEVTTFATTGGASIPSTINGPYNKFLYVPRLRGAVYVPCYSVDLPRCASGNAWFLRLH